MTTIAQERAALKKVGRPLISREDAGFRFKRYGEAKSVSEPAGLVFVHITITNPKSYASDAAHARAVEAIGISRFPNTGISYNRLIMQSGRAYEGQPMGRRGAHTINDKKLAHCVSPGCPSKGGPIPPATINLNTRVRAYAICQNVSDAVTDAQLDSLARTIAADVLAGMVARDFDLHGHRCTAPKDCPAAKMWARMGELRKLIDHYIKVGFGVKPPTGPTPSKPPSGGTTMAFDATEIAQMRAATQAETEEFAIRFWVHPSGTGTALINLVKKISLQCDRIEDDTDDGLALKADIAQVRQMLESNVSALAALHPGVADSGQATVNAAEVLGSVTS